MLIVIGSCPAVGATNASLVIVAVGRRGAINPVDEIAALPARIVPLLSILAMPDKAEPLSSPPARFVPGGLPCLIGSLPLTDHETAIAWIFQTVPEIPLWPQLPKNRLEGMLHQFIEGFPAVAEDGDRLYFDTKATGFDQELLKFYEEYIKILEEPDRLTGSRFETTIRRAAGMYALREAAKSHDSIRAIKGQITGPFTLLTGIRDQDQRLSYYDAALRDMAVKCLAMKAAWQVKFFRNFNVPYLLMIDEPALTGLGSSSFISISREDVSQDLTEVIAAIHAAGGLAGIHVCGNTDWGLLLSLDIDILSFDAFGFFDRLIAFKPQIHAFLDRGGILAWGLVPTAGEKEISQVDLESLTAKWELAAATLITEKWTIPALLSQALLTPSCGTGSLTEELARRVLNLTRDLSATLRQKHFPDLEGK